MGGARVRMTFAGFAACLTLIGLAKSFGGPRQEPGPVDLGKAGVVRVRATTNLAQAVAIPRKAASLDDENEIAGLARGSTPELVGWQEAYKLAVIRARAGRGPLLQSLDPAALSRQAERLGAADFARFRDDFFARGAFRDPAKEMFALLYRLQQIDNARHRLAVLEGLKARFPERSQDQSSGLSRLDVDTLFAAAVKAGEALNHQKRQFRDALDAFKVALGVSMQAAIIPDRKEMAGFHDVFDSVARWECLPERHPGQLLQVITLLPELGDVILDGQPLLSAIQVNPDRWESSLLKAARLALENRSDPARKPLDEDARVQLELQIRRTVRHLFEMRLAYEDAKRGYEYAVRMKDQALERLHAPSANGPQTRSSMVEQLVAQIASLMAFEDRLAELWTTFRAERLTLYRELGVLPYSNWKAFYADLTAQQSDAEGMRSN